MATPSARRIKLNTAGAAYVNGPTVLNVLAGYI
jgi:hypothetical protein